MKYLPLISAEELASRLDDDIRIFDCRFSLMDAALGARLYREGHIPGALHADLDRNLADLAIPHAGRHPLPDRETFRHWLESCGVSDSTPVVCYDDSGGAIAARLWWMVRWLGLDDVRVLDGGLESWRSHGYTLDSALPETTPGRITVRPPANRVSDVEDILEVVNGAQRRLLLDAREAARYAGEVEPLDPVAGHVPGALNSPFSGNLDAHKCFLAPARLRSRFQSLIGATDPEDVVHMCGSGVTACHNLLAMEVAGMHGSRLFPGSWSQWVDDPERPVALGKEA